MTYFTNSLEGLEVTAEDDDDDEALSKVSRRVKNAPDICVDALTLDGHDRILRVVAICHRFGLDFLVSPPGAMKIVAKVTPFSQRAYHIMDNDLGKR